MSKAANLNHGTDLGFIKRILAWLRIETEIARCERQAKNEGKPEEIRADRIIKLMEYAGYHHEHDGTVGSELKPKCYTAKWNKIDEPPATP